MEETIKSPPGKLNMPTFEILLSPRKEENRPRADTARQKLDIAALESTFKEKDIERKQIEINRINREAAESIYKEKEIERKQIETNRLDREALEKTFIYNTDAINGNFSKAQYDEYGNPVGGTYDLAKDGSFKGFKVLIGCFYLGEGLPESIDKLTVPELKKKGFEVIISKDESDFIRRISTEKYHCSWIISSSTFNGEKEEFRKAVVTYHKQGRGLFIFGDNAPYFAHANIICPELMGCTLQDNTPGGKELVPGNAKSAGQFGKHLITTGVLKLNEGITICYPSTIAQDVEIVGTSSNNHPVLVCKNENMDCGRIIIDNGFTKLMESYWSTAGTPRYISNCCVWLVHRERFKTATM